MELENIKQNTVWNDAAESINSNFAKIRQKMALIESGSGGSGSGAVDTAMSDTSENAVQNKVIKKYVDERAEQAYGQANEYTDEEIEHIEGVLNERIDGIVHVVYYYDGLSEEHKAENKKAYDAIMAGIDSCYVITDKTSSTKIIASAALKSSTIAGLMAYQIMPTSKDEITIGLLTLSIYEDGSTEQTTTLSYVLNREAVNALLSGKQNTLVSGTTIKTINGQDILGEGDIVIESGGSDIVVDSSLDMNSENPIQNQAVAKQFSGLSEYLQEQYVSYSERFDIIQNQLPWISIVDFETAIEQEEPIGDDVRNALLEIGGYNPDNPYSTQGWVWSQGYLYTVKVIPTDAGVQIQLFSFKGWTEIAEDNSKVNHLPSQGGGNVEVDAELSETSENAVGNKAVTMALAETEEVAAAALNELNKRFDDYATKEDIDATLAEVDNEINHIEGVLEATIIEDEEVAAAALNDLDKRVTDLEQNGGGEVSANIDSEMSDTSENAVANKVIKKYVDDSVKGKQDVISDIAEIRRGAGLGATALQSYTEQYTGTYNKPSGGIPKSDLASDVQTSLGKADTALQSVPGTYVTKDNLAEALAPIGTLYKGAWIAAKTEGISQRYTEAITLPAGTYIISCVLPYAKVGHGNQICIGFTAQMAIGVGNTFLNASYGCATMLATFTQTTNLAVMSAASANSAEWDYLDRGGIAALRII